MTQNWRNGDSAWSESMPGQQLTAHFGNPLRHIEQRLRSLQVEGLIERPGSPGG